MNYKKIECCPSCGNDHIVGERIDYDTVVPMCFACGNTNFNDYIESDKRKNLKFEKIRRN